ncbi:MAG: DUF167 domain-containing protein [Rhodospirillales bacterium]|nr:DUF167 domain-containing protein [Rhodospirillales bacterium]
MKLTPSAARNEIRGWEDGPNGPQTILKASVTTAPEKGKANKALITFLSKELNIPRSAVHIIRGETERLKTVRLPTASLSKLPPKRD